MRFHIVKLQCTKFDFGRGRSVPYIDGRVYSGPSDPWDLTSKGTEKRGERKGKVRGKGGKREGKKVGKEIRKKGIEPPLTHISGYATKIMRYFLYR